MRRLSAVLGLFPVLVALLGPAPSYGFLLDAGWTEERELDYPLYTDEGRCLLGKTTVMRHAATREWRGLFSPFDNDVVALSGGVEQGEDGSPRKVVKLEASNAVGYYADFRPVFVNGECTAFAIVVYDESDQEVGRHVVYKDRFDALVDDAHIPSTDDCARGRVSETLLGRWADFSCGADRDLFLFSPFDSTEPMVAVWNERGADPQRDVEVFFALRTRSGRWAKTRMINDYQLQWDMLRKEGDERVMAFEVTLRDEQGNAFVRRVYDRSNSDQP